MATTSSARSPTVSQKIESLFNSSYRIDSMVYFYLCGIAGEHIYIQKMAKECDMCIQTARTEIKVASKIGIIKMMPKDTKIPRKYVPYEFCFSTKFLPLIRSLARQVAQ